MSSYIMFSKRTKQAAQAEQPDVYQYDELPGEFREQVIHIWKRAMPPDDVFDVWRGIHDDLAEEHGLACLGDGSPDGAVREYFRTVDEVGKALDVIERTFRELSAESIFLGEATQKPEDAIEQLNDRFREHSIGYRYETGQIVRVDSQYVHAEVVKPALVLLDDPAFKGPEDEFLKAHRLYREGDFKGALVEANKAFESTMLVVCQVRRLSHPKGLKTAGAMIDVLSKAGLVPSNLNEALLAIPKIRNNEGAHGQGDKVKEVPQHLAAYALHVTASTIVMLVEAHRANP